MRVGFVSGFIVVVAVALMVASPPNAQAAEFQPAIGHKGYGRCHMDTCSFFIIDRATPVGDGRDGTLFEIQERDWGADYRPPAENAPDSFDEYAQPPIHVSKQEPGTSTVYCSKTRPTVFDRDGGKWVSTPLRPGDDGAVFGFNESAYQWYFAACHAVIVHEPNPNHLAQRLGYHFKHSDGGGEQGSTAPRDMLK